VLIAAKLLLLVLIANGAPLAMKVLLGRRWAVPLDGGRRLADGRPVLGESKTLRGLVAGIAAPAVAAPLLGLDIAVGLTIGALAMLGDIVSSFVKRRMRLAPSANAPLLDQLPEVLFPLLVVRSEFDLTWLTLVELIGVFVVINLALTPMARVLRRRLSASR
jgi:CDP-2,3-bis-(O-geranylgeranyl)-sn-glycerol synthase